MEAEKVKAYVQAEIFFDQDGKMEPRAFYWNERWRRIDQVYEVRRMPFASGGAGYRYTIRVGRQIGFIMYDSFEADIRWFIETTAREASQTQECDLAQALDDAPLLAP